MGAGVLLVRIKSKAPYILDIEADLPSPISDALGCGFEICETCHSECFQEELSSSESLSATCFARFKTIRFGARSGKSSGKSSSESSMRPPLSSILVSGLLFSRFSVPVSLLSVPLPPAVFSGPSLLASLLWRFLRFRLDSPVPSLAPPGTSATRFGSTHALHERRRSTVSFASGASSLLKKLYTVAFEVCFAFFGLLSAFPLTLLLPALPHRWTYCSREPGKS
mmetsp:Transcript_27331/g.60422  ORF Transcript_27331/g.60422 Transcript_27331/m.60422 type:complete len:224 (-) Transcript_27331:3-674(-)